MKTEQEWNTIRQECKKILNNKKCVTCRKIIGTQLTPSHYLFLTPSTAHTKKYCGRQCRKQTATKKLYEYNKQKRKTVIKNDDNT